VKTKKPLGGAGENQSASGLFDGKIVGMSSGVRIGSNRIGLAAIDAVDLGRCQGNRVTVAVVGGWVYVTCPPAVRSAALTMILWACPLVENVVRKGSALIIKRER